MAQRTAHVSRHCGNTCLDCFSGFTEPASIRVGTFWGHLLPVPSLHSAHDRVGFQKKCSFLTRVMVYAIPLLYC